MSKVIVLGGILLGVLYQVYKNSEASADTRNHYHLVSEYFIGDTLKRDKPFLWVHVGAEVNARKWESFYSRTSTKLNQPYLYITLKSIYDKCSKTFNVCLVDDTVFDRLIPEWSIKVDTLANPLKEHYRSLGMTSLVYYYGGMVVPSSLLCLRDLLPLYQKEKVFVGEMVNHSVLAAKFSPSPVILGGQKGCPTLRAFMAFQESLAYTNQDVYGTMSRWWLGKPCLDGRFVGVKSAANQPIRMEDLLSTAPLDLSKDAYAIYLPADELLRSTKFSWFCRLSIQQVLQSKFTLSKHILASY